MLCLHCISNGLPCPEAILTRGSMKRAQHLDDDQAQSLQLIETLAPCLYGFSLHSSLPLSTTKMSSAHYYGFKSYKKGQFTNVSDLKGSLRQRAFLEGPNGERALELFDTLPGLSAKDEKERVVRAVMHDVDHAIIWALTVDESSLATLRHHVWVDDQEGASQWKTEVASYECCEDTSAREQGCMTAVQTICQKTKTTRQEALNISRPSQEDNAKEGRSSYMSDGIWASSDHWLEKPFTDDVFFTMYEPSSPPPSGTSKRNPRDGRTERGTDSDNGPPTYQAMVKRSRADY